MFRWIYDLVTNEFLYGGPYDPPFNVATQGLVKLPRNPAPRLERYDGAGGIRAATTADITAYDAARASDNEQGQFDGAKMLKAVSIFFAQQLNIPLATAKAGILTIYRGL